MKRRFWKIALLAVPFALYAYIAERNSWRPVLIKMPEMRWMPQVVLSPNRQYLALSAGRDVDSVSDVYLINIHQKRVVRKFDESIRPFFVNDFVLRVDPNPNSWPSAPSSLARKFFTIPDGRSLVSNSYFEKYSPKQFLDRTAKDSRGKMLHFFQFWPLSDGTTVLAGACWPLIRADNPAAADCENLWFWDSKNEQLRFPLKSVKSIVSLDSNSSGICVITDGDFLDVWDYKTGQRIERYPISMTSEGSVKTGQREKVEQIVLSPDGELLAGSNGFESHVHIWNIKSGKVLTELGVGNKVIPSLAFSTDSRFLAVAAYDTVKIQRIK